MWHGMPAFLFVLGKSDGREMIYAMRLMPSARFRVDMPAALHTEGH
jgi:hypothetical protein